MSYPLTLGRRAGMEYPPVHALEAFCFSAAPTLDALRHVSEFIPTFKEVTREQSQLGGIAVHTPGHHMELPGTPRYFTSTSQGLPGTSHA